MPQRLTYDNFLKNFYDKYPNSLIDFNGEIREKK